MQNLHQNGKEVDAAVAHLPKAMSKGLTQLPKDFFIFYFLLPVSQVLA